MLTPWIKIGIGFFVWCQNQASETLGVTMNDLFEMRGR